MIGWKKGIDLVVKLYKFADSLPATEKYGLARQITRAAVSIPSNVAEGYARNSRIEYAHFVDIALGSTREIQTQLEICRRLGFGDPTNEIELAEEEARILLALSRSLRKE